MSDRPIWPTHRRKAKSGRHHHRTPEPRTNNERN